MEMDAVARLRAAMVAHGDLAGLPLLDCVAGMAAQHGLPLVLAALVDMAAMVAAVDGREAVRVHIAEAIARAGETILAAHLAAQRGIEAQIVPCPGWSAGTVGSA